MRFPDGSRIPRLRTALRAIEGRRITVMLDVKSTSPRDFRRVVEEVYEANAQSNVIVQCQNKDLVAFMKREFPGVSLLARAHHETEVYELLAYSPQFVQIDHDWDLAGVIPLIHGRGSRVVVKTLAPETDRPEVWKRLCGVGVDVVLTDKPRDFVTSGPFGPPSESAESNSEKEPGA